MKPRSPSRGRLSRSAEFERVYRQGRSTANRHLVLYTFPNPAAERPRLGLSVSRKVGGAVERNHVKRLLREAFAGAEPELSSGQDIVVVARPQVRELAEREGLAGIDASLSELIARAGLSSGAPLCAQERAVSASAAHRGRTTLTGAVSRVARARGDRADRRLPAGAVSRAAAALQVRADVLALCGRCDQGVRHTQGLGARRVAVAQVQPMELRRVRSGARAAPLQARARRARARRASILS